jgi:hypothetical protein
MRHHLLPLLVVTALGAACESSPASPTITPARTAPAVATAQVNVWDSRDELQPWIAPNISTGALSISGEASDAVIRVDVGQGGARLRGPELDPAANQVGSARLRFRWLDAGQNESIFMSMYLRPVEFGDSLLTPRLTVPATGGASTEQRSGNWLERTLSVTSGSSQKPPFTVKYAVLDLLTLGNVQTGALHGVVEIDWIALLR